MAPTRTLSNTTTPSLITESHEYQDGATYEEGLERDASIESHSNLFSDAGKPTHAFQVKKIYHNLPPIISFPPSLSFAIHPVTGGSSSQRPSPTFHTSRLSILHIPFLPPPFTVFSGPAPILPPNPSKLPHHSSEIHHIDTHPGDASSIATSSTGAEKEKEVAHIRYKGGIKRLEVQISSAKKESHGTESGLEEHAKIMTEVRRRGWGRSYHFTLSSGALLVWRGVKGDPGTSDSENTAEQSTTSAQQPVLPVSAQTTTNHPMSRTEKRASHGNLRLYAEADPSKCLGLWLNKTDVNVLGELMIFEDLEGEALEIVVLAALAVVLGERVRYKGWFLWEAGVPKGTAD